MKCEIYFQDKKFKYESRYVCSENHNQIYVKDRRSNSAFISIMLQFFALFTCVLIISTYADDLPSSVIAANKYLFATHVVSGNSRKNQIQYQCSTNREKIAYAQLKFDFDAIGIGKAQNQSQLYFVAIGRNFRTPCMSKITIHCNNDDELTDEMICFNETHRYGIEPSAMVVDVYGNYAIRFVETNVFFYDLVSLQYSVIDITWPNCTTEFVPCATDISIQFVYLTGYCIEERNDSQDARKMYNIKRIVYLLSTAVNNIKYDIQIHDLWLHESLYRGSNIKCPSISVNNDVVEERILVGFLADNTVHLLSINKSIGQPRFQFISSKQDKHDNPDFVYGRQVTWANYGEKAVISYDINKCVSQECYGFFLYDMTNCSQFINETVALYTFPNENQRYPQEYTERSVFTSIIATSTNPSGLYMYNSYTQLLVLLPSDKGYYSTTYGLPTDLSVSNKIFFLFPNVIPCPYGTYKNDAGILPCRSCETTLLNTSQLQSYNEDSIRLTCPQCSDKESCPQQFVYAIEDFSDVEQISTYPDTSETEVFDDILLYQMFRTDCSWNSPFYYSLISLFAVLFLAILISLLKLYKHFAWHYRRLTRLFRRVDFIEQGEFWFGGLLTIVVFVLLGFAIKFSHVFHSRYSIEQGMNIVNDTCLHQLNAKFETSLQFVGSSPGQHREIFHLLDSQQFTLNIEFIHTLFHSGQLTIHYADITDSLPFSYRTIGRVLYISVNLTSHNSYLKLNFKGNETIDAIRIGITGANTFTTNNFLQKLHFSKLFHLNNFTFKQYPVFNLQLTKVINITEGLTINDETRYSGIWLPTFTFDVNQLFEKKNHFNNRKETVLSLSISETPFFIQNKQQPLAKRFEIIFKTILFATVCLEFTCIILLLSKLWLIPIIQIIIRKLFRRTNCLHRLIIDDKNTDAILSTDF